MQTPAPLTPALPVLDPLNEDGLGFEFLKHVRRCRVLLHVVDCSSIDVFDEPALLAAPLRRPPYGLIVGTAYTPA